MSSSTHELDVWKKITSKMCTTCTTFHFRVALKRFVAHGIGVLFIGGVLVPMGSWAGENEAQWQQLLSTGAQLVNDGSLEQAKVPLNKALALAATFPQPDLRYATTLEWLALACWQLGQIDEAQRLYRDQLDNTPSSEVARLLVPLRQLGMLAVQQQRYDAAEGYLRRYLTISESLPGEDPERAMCLEELACACYRQGKLEDAEQLFSRALATKEQLVGPDNVELAQTLLHLARTRLSLGHGDNAGVLLERALHLQERAFGESSRKLVPTLELMVFQSRSSGELEQAAAQCHRIIALEEAAGEPESDVVVTALENLTQIFAARYGLGERFHVTQLVGAPEDWQRHRQICARLLEIRQRRYAHGERQLIGVQSQLVWLDIIEGAFDEAQDMQRGVVDLAVSVFGKKAWETASQLNNLGVVYFAAQRYKQALREFAEAIEIDEESPQREPEAAQVLLRNYIVTAEHAGKTKQVQEIRQRLQATMDAKLGL